MPVKTRDEVVIRRGNGEMAQEAVAEAPVTTGYGSAKAAAEAAAEQYGVDEIEKHAQYIATAWEERLREQIKANQNRTRAMAGTEAAGPITFPLYQWWNVLLAGPFQPLAPLGPFLPHKVIAHGEPAFMIAALVRNPNPLPPGGPNPSAAQIMSAYEYRVRLQTGNLTTWDPGPAFGPTGDVFGAGFVNFELIDLTGFALPADGSPDLYEANLVMDVLGPGTGLPPFAGYSTWVLDPDIELPGLFTPGAGPQLQYDIPARFLIYR